MSIREWFTRRVQKKESAVARAIVVGRGMGSWSQDDLEKVAREGFEGNGVANACITGISDAVAGIEWFLKAEDGTKIENPETHPYMQLWNRPNPTMSRATFLRATTTYFFAEGNSYLERTKGKIELWPLRPDRVTIGFNEKDTNPLPWYEYKVGGANPVRFENEYVLHLKVFSPTDDFYGRSPLKVAATAIDTDNESMRWNYDLVKNGGRPSGVFNIEGELQPDQYSRLQSEIAENWSGRNSIRPKLLENGLKWTATGMTPHDMDFIQGLRILARRICMVLNYPPELVGDSENKTYSNYMEARKALYQDVVCPFLDYVRDEVNHWLAPLFGGGVLLEYDRDDIEALQENRGQLFDRVGSADWLTINEQREATGYPRIEDPEYDKPRAASAAAMPIFGAPEGEPADEDEEEEVDAEAERPEIDEEEEGEEAAPKGSRFWNLHEKARDEKAAAFQQLERERGVFAAQLAKDLRRHFRKEGRALQRLLAGREDLEAALPAIEKFLKAQERPLGIVLRKWFMVTARWFFERARLDLKAGTGPEERKASTQWLREMRVHFQAEVPKKAKLIYETSQRQIENILTRGIDAGSSTDDIVDQLMDLYDERYAKSRSDTIADTEIVGVSNYGTMVGAKSTDKVVLKHWTTMNDDVVRDSHEEAQDEYEPGIPQGDLFHVGESRASMMFPGDTSHGPPLEEIINCRCWVTYSEAT